eukprot:TRINITY_DN3512_c0_g1_i2.p1 TRINITY_DN3512_c0_g1~~TRINITY_DN3512_c0_g1_i2.p1  ORF type:complete len:447 (-),score=112.08 TRINITY_DN3512_c0_g1_i2:632-1972(-)
MLSGEDEKKRSAIADDDDDDDVPASASASKDPSIKPSMKPRPQEDDDDEPWMASKGSTPAAASAPAAATTTTAPNAPETNDKPFTMVPNFKTLLGGRHFPGLWVDRHCSFQIMVDSPEKVERKGSGIAGGIGMKDSFYTFRVTVITNTPSFLSLPAMPSDAQLPSKLQAAAGAGQLRRFQVHRRYNDFAWLRDALVDEFPGVPVSPLPEKDAKGALDKILQQDLHPLLEYRCRGFRKFLTSLGAHPVLAVSETLRAFFTLPRDQMALDGAPVRAAPGTSDPEGVGSLRSTDFSHFTLYRDALSAKHQQRKSARGDGTLGRKVEALAGMFTKRFKPAHAQEASITLPVHVDAERQYFIGFRDSVGEMRDALAYLRDTHKYTHGAFRQIAEYFRALAAVETQPDPFLHEEYVGVAGQWRGMCDLQADLLEAESKMVMDGLYHYFNWCP